jgi:hypothetical protein
MLRWAHLVSNPDGPSVPEGEMVQVHLGCSTKDAVAGCYQIESVLD